jgi:hypothetical protein
MILHFRPQITLTLSFTLCNLISASNSVTRITKVCRTPTEPHRNWTTKLTFKINKFRTMCLTIHHTCSRTNKICLTLRTNKLLRLEFSLLLLIPFACLHSSEIRHLAFKTLVVWAHMLCISLQVFMSFTLIVNFIKPFSFCPLDWLLIDHLFDINRVIDHRLEIRIVFSLHSDLALDTIQKLQYNPRCCPAVLKYCF